MQVIIWDDKSSPEEHIEGQLVLWRSYDLENYPDAISIPKLIEKNAEDLRSRYLALVYELGKTRIHGKKIIDHLGIRQGFSYWWMTLIAEKCNWAKSPQIVDVIRLFALHDWTDKEDINRIKLISSNKDLAESLEIWSESSGIAFDWNDIPKTKDPIPWIKRIYLLLPDMVVGLLWLIKYIIMHWHLRGVGLDEWKQSKGQITFVSYLFNLVPEATKSGHFESRYWTQLPRALTDEGAITNWLHIYVKDSLLPNSRKAGRVIRSFNDNFKQLQTHVTLSSFLSFKVIIQSLSDWLRLRKEGKDLESELCKLPNARYLWPLFREDWRISIFKQTSINNLLMFNLFESAFIQLPSQKKGVYLQENQGWEFGLNHAWKRGGHHGLIGFPHSVVRFWDLRYFFHPLCYDRKESSHIPIPDQIACNGKSALKAYKNGGYPDNELTKVEALRYLYLAKTPTHSKSSTPKKGKRLLVVGDYLGINTHKQLHLLERAAPLLRKGTKITIKPHPNCPVNPALYPQLKMNVELRQLSELMEEHDLVYSSAVTSAAVDAYCAGLPVVSLLDGGNLNLSPLRNCDGVTFVSNPEDLANLVNHDHIEDSGKVQGEDYFYFDLKLPRWRKLLLDNTNA